MIQNKQITIPHDSEAEQAVLGAIIEDNDLLNSISEILTPEDYYLEKHQCVYHVMLELMEEDISIDEIILGDRLKILGQLDEIGGYAYLAELSDCCPSSGNIDFYATFIKNHSTARSIIRVGSDVSREARDPEKNIEELLLDVSEKIENISDKKNKNNTIPIKDVLYRSFVKLEKTSENKDELLGLSTGFLDFDRTTLGLIPKDLIILAARPGSGKTSLAMNMATGVALNPNTKGAVLVISIEMADEQLAMRMLSAEAKVSLKRIRKGDLEEKQWDKLAMATDRLSVINLHINDSADTIQSIKSAVKKLYKTKDGIALLVVDYLQIIVPPNNINNREQQIAYFSRSLKKMAKDFDIPVIALAQLNRAIEKRSEKKPMLSDLRESGAIENDADLIVFIYRDELYNEDSPDKGIAEIIIGKHRNGETGTIRLTFIGKYTKFCNLSQQADYDL